MPAPAALPGTHDFTAFTPTETGAPCASSARSCAPSGSSEPLEPPHPGELLELWIEADSFMRHMVRVLVGTMLEVAGGGARSRTSGGCSTARRASDAGPTAQPHGLYLAAVRY